MTRLRAVSVIIALMAAMLIAGIAMARDSVILMSFGGLCLWLATAGGLALGGDHGRDAGSDQDGSKG